ncbi:MAG: hypothetical protein JKY37_17265 [Nannocystaceae bacterium]|nr:hypothetical protein [Nannocystaceae bacterium]
MQPHPDARIEKWRFWEFRLSGVDGTDLDIQRCSERDAAARGKLNEHGSH